jgi:hypothetical protein
LVGLCFVLLVSFPLAYYPFLSFSILKFHCISKEREIGSKKPKSASYVAPRRCTVQNDGTLCFFPAHRFQHLLLISLIFRCGVSVTSTTLSFMLLLPSLMHYFVGFLVAFSKALISVLVPPVSKKKRKVARVQIMGIFNDSLKI